MSSELVHHALLIGIDCYMPFRLPSGESYHCLGGCVRDVELMETMLRGLLGVPDERIVRLTASGCGPQPTEPPAEWPTRRNIIEALQRLASTVSAGEHVHIHYSGHGGRARTIYEDVKGTCGIDETLVPTDVGTSTGGPIRDLELAKLIGAVVDRGAVVAVTLDCCHSGGITRGVRRRGIDGVDTRAFDPAELVVSPGEALAMMAGRVVRSVDRVAGLLPDPRGYTVLAACLKTESAHEMPFDGEVQGALTHWLLRLLPRLGAGVTYRALCDRIVAQLHAQLPGQTPIVMGEVDRVVLGASRGLVRYAARISGEHPERGVRLDVGRAHGVAKGAHFVAVADEVPGADDETRGLADLVVREVADVQSWADVAMRDAAGPLEVGTPVVLVGPSSTRLVRKVALVDGAQASLLDALATAGWVAPVGDGELAELQVALDDRDRYRILDAVGEPLPWLLPEIDASEPGAAVRVIARLEHLSRFRALQQLANHDVTSPLVDRLQLELLGWTGAYEPGDPFEPSGVFHGPATVEVGQWAALRIRNAARLPLNVCLFDLQPCWAATLVWPADGAGFRTLDPGEHEVVVLQLGLPPHVREGVDVLKAFGTVGSTDFRWLELPGLDQPRQPRRNAPRSELERLLAAGAKTRPATRDVVLASARGSEWTAVQVELTVCRPAAEASK